LRPLGIGELLDGAFTTIRRYPAATLGLSAAVMLVVEVVRLFSTYYLLRGITIDTTSTSTSTAIFNAQQNVSGRLDLSNGIVALVTLIATVLLTGMLTAVIGQAVLGRPMGIAEAWARVRPMIGRLLGATICVFLVVLLAAVVGFVPGLILLVVGLAVSSDALIAFGIVVGLLASFVIVIYVGTLLLFTTPVLVLEKATIRTAMSRSRALVRSSWWRIFGITLLAQIIAVTIGGIISLPFAVLAAIVAGIFSGHFSGNITNEFNFVPLLLTSIGGPISATLVRPFSSGVMALLYIDRRMRAEALDLTLQRAAASDPR
jgi:MFS family permease